MFSRNAPKLGMCGVTMTYRWQRIKTSHKQNTQCPGNTKTISKQTRNRVFATSIFAICTDFAFEF